MKNKLDPIDAVVELLKRGRFDYADERVCQRQMELQFLKVGVVFEKEYAFLNGTADFFFPRSGIVLEVKASKNWNKTRVYRQCERYCENDIVKGLVLATGKAQGLPEKILGKPVRVYQLGVGQL